MGKTTSAVRFEHHGDPDVLKMQDVALVPPAEGELQIEHEAIGVNYIDIYHRKGVYAPPLPLPAGLGMEGVGVVRAVGGRVDGFAVGDRVAYVGGPPDAYSRARNLPAARALKLPSDLTSELTAGLCQSNLA